MEDNYYLKNCNDDDILSFDDITFKVGTFKKALTKSLDNNLGNQISYHLSANGVKIPDSILNPYGTNNSHVRWFHQGMDCEILNLGAKSWKKGKVKIKISVEFYLEDETDNNALEISEPESPLDDLRRMMNQENQQ
jgi:KGK domain